VSVSNEIVNRLSPRDVRLLATTCMAAGVAVDVLVTRRAHLRTTLMQTRSSVWRRLDRPGGALVMAGIALLRASAAPSRAR
jgi:hypothetical protein